MLKRIRLGQIYAHQVTFSEALSCIGDLIEQGRGGFVVTPNVDHVVQAEESEALRAAYQSASLSLVDGKPLVWLSHWMGEALPEKISGSDLVEPLIREASKEGWRVFLLGAAPGVGAKAAEVLQRDNPGLQLAGVHSPPFGFDEDEAECQKVLSMIAEAKADLVLVALGCPKQELWMHRYKDALAPAVVLGIGATLDFIAGNVQRAPKWMSNAGLEWAYRLAREPRRLAHRYLVRDPQIVKVAWRMLRLPKDARAD